MKKLIICFLILSCVLAGCGNNATTDPTTDSPFTTEATAPTTDPQPQGPTVQSPMVTVSVPGMLTQYTAEDRTVLLQYFRQSMSLIVPDQEVADKIIVDFLNRVDQTQQTADDLHLQAQSAYQNASSRMPFLCNIAHTPARIDQTVLSLYGNHIVYSGGAHPSYSCCAANYDMLTGDVLTLGSILTGPDAKDSLRQLVIAQLDTLADEKYLWPSYPDTVTQRFAVEESYDENWYFSQDGLCFFFAPYEIAAYASGVIIAEVPYSLLSGIIDDAFFPPEADSATGTMSVMPASEADLDQYTRFSELILDPDVPALVLSTDATVHNVRITAKNHADGNIYTAYAAQALNAGDAILIEAEEQTAQDLVVTYESNGQTITLELGSN